MALTGRVVVVTGATGNLGPAVCRAFARAGASLALSARSEESLSDLLSALALPEDSAVAFPGDLADPAVAQDLANRVLGRFGRVDVVLHLAGGYRPGAPVSEMALSDLQAMLDINLATTFNVAHAFLPQLTANGWGRMVAMSSAYGQQPAARTAAYAASKAAMEALLGAVAQEVKTKGVTVNVVVVRTIDTPEARQAAPKTASFGAWTTPEEIASTMLFLCSDDAAAINGARIPLYGRG